MVANTKPTAKPTIDVTTIKVRAVITSNAPTVNGLSRKWMENTQSIHPWAKPNTTRSDQIRCISPAKDPSPRPVFLGSSFKFLTPDLT